MQRLQHFARARSGGRLAFDRDLVATRRNIDAEPVFDGDEIAVELTEQRAHQMRLVKGDFEAGDIARSLLRLYLFALDRVYDSLIHKEDRGLAEARKVLATLREAWEQVPAEDFPNSAEMARVAARMLEVSPEDLPERIRPGQGELPT